MKIAIYGAGAMGTILGAYIQKAGKDIDLFSRNKEHIAALKKAGAHIIGKVDFIQKVNAFLPEEMKESYDIIFLMTKTLDNLNIVKKLNKFLQKDGVICTMQNGLPELSVSEVIGKDRTLGCAMVWGATMHGKGVSELTTIPSRNTLSFNMGSYGNVDKEKVKAVKETLELMGEVTFEENFIGARWAKLTINSAFSGLSALFNAKFGEIAKNMKSRKLVLTIIKECIDVAEAAGIKVEPIQGHDIVKLLDYKSEFKRRISLFLIPIAMKKHKDLKSSMLQDINRGRKCEIEAINGAVCKHGKEYNQPTPLNDKIVKLVHDIEDGKLKSSWDNITLLKEFIK